jgi:hypothetical protein
MCLAQDKRVAPVTFGFNNTQESLGSLRNYLINKTILPQDINQLQVLWKRVCDA